MSCLIKCTIITVLLVMSSLANAETNDAAKDLRLILRLDATTIFLHEPVYATVVLQSSSLESLRVPTYIFNSLRFFRAYNKEKFVSCGYGKDTGCVDRATHILEPDKEIVAPDELLFLFVVNGGPVGFVFDKPGKYRVKAQVRLDKEVLESNTIDVTVKQPPEDDAAAIDLLVDLKHMVILNGSPLWVVDIQQIEQLVNKYPGSRYADYAHFRVAQQYLTQTYRGQVGEKVAVIKAYESYSSVSNRIPGLRLRALCRQVEMVCRYAEVRDKADIPELQSEIVSSTDTAKVIGYEKKVAALQEKLKGLAESELRK